MPLKKILTNGCIFFTIIITAFYTFGLVIDKSGQWIPTLRVAYSLLGFSMLFSALCTAVGKMRMTYLPKLAIHFAACAVLYYLVFVLGGGFAKNGGSTLAAMIVFLFVYVLGAVVVSVGRRLTKDEKKTNRSKKNDGDEDDYKSIFNK